MPNWCYNEITVKGHPNDIKKISSIIENQKENGNFKLFQSLIGLPEGTDIEKYNSNECDYWYDINIDWFGTKWDVGFEFVEEIKDDYILLSGETAWSPPVNFCKVLSKLYNVQVEMYYEECGFDFCGKSWINSEKEYKEQCYEFSHGIYLFHGFEYWYDRQWDSMSDYLLEELYEEGTPDFKMVIINNLPFINDEEIEKLTKELEYMFKNK